MRSLPQVPRTTPIEFLEALGALYRSAGATSVVAQVAWDRFRTESAKLCGQSSRKLSAVDITLMIERRFGAIAADMGPDFLAAEEACADERLKPRKALGIVRGLHRHEETLRAASAARIGILKKVS